ncbi:MAG: sigma-54 dependent transcriptional regulator [Ghiorsea sp.]|nr:sigma-54 dependent transcriptional regulator [Ghiorsea sp.]MDQ7057090.1 sigma-54 dependent transcriptional regulator [Ghiorsea sp.]
MTIQILIVDDEQPIRESLSGLFEDEGYLVSHSASGEEAVARFRKNPADCVFLDIWMPGIDGLETMARLKQINPDVPIIMMSGHATIDTAVKATKQGAFDFIEKPFSLDKLLITLRNAVEKRRLELENSDLKVEVNNRSPQFVGRSKAVSLIRRQLDKMKMNKQHMILQGQHGVGKSIAARIVHEGSGHSQVGFVAFKALGLDEQAIDAELFGYEKGAFTGALQARRGRLEVAHNGTLYIEEIADIPMRIQEKIVQVMLKHRLQHLGNTRYVPCDTRLILGSKHDKETLLQHGSILQAFYSQLHMITMTLPNLQERAEDISDLLQMLTAEQVAHLGGEPVHFSKEVVQLLQAYAWPGNVRELRNYVERCHLLCSGQVLTPETMLSLDENPQSPLSFSAVPDDTVLQDGFHDARKRFERSYILHHLDKNNWNISKTAVDIGMERSQLHRKIKAHDLIAKD